MRAGVIPHGRAARGGIDGDARVVPDADLTVRDLTAVDHDAVDRALRVLDNDAPCAGFDRSAIALLAAALGVERRLFDDDLDPIPGLRHVGGFAPD